LASWKERLKLYLHLLVHRTKSSLHPYILRLVDKL
jgi:hypothetical protein